MPVGALRIAAIAAAAPVIEDAVIAGHDRDDDRASGVPEPRRLPRAVPASGPDAPLAALIAEPAVRAGGDRRDCGATTQTAGGSSQRIDRALLLAEPPSIDQGEITDKGYINQRAVLTRRAALVARLYAEPPDANVIVL